jgi:predicted nucleic acid-binding protein
MTLPIVIDPSTPSRALQSIIAIAGKERLTVYDASYLEIAAREKIPLFTLDKLLIKAAKKLHVMINPS